MKKNLALRSRHMMLGGRTGQLGMLPEAWFTGDVQLRRWAIIAIVLFATIQHFLWSSLDEMWHEPHYFVFVYLLVYLLNLYFNMGFMYCLLENLSSTVSRGVRTGLRAGSLVFYLFALMLSFAIGLIGDYSYFGLTTHIMFGRVDGMVNSMGSPIADMYIITTALGSIGALAGALLGYLSDKLADGVRKICGRQLGSW